VGLCGLWPSLHLCSRSQRQKRAAPSLPGDQLSPGRFAVCRARLQFAGVQPTRADAGKLAVSAHAEDFLLRRAAWPRVALVRVARRERDSSSGGGQYCTLVASRERSSSSLGTMVMAEDEACKHWGRFARQSSDGVGKA
jgi:hypothetical protein